MTSMRRMDSGVGGGPGLPARRIGAVANRPKKSATLRNARRLRLNGHVWAMDRQISLSRHVAGTSGESISIGRWYSNGFGPCSRIQSTIDFNPSRRVTFV